MHVVDSRFLIDDDGRIVFRTWNAYVVIPEADLRLVRRRNFQANLLGAVALLASNIGWPQAYWRPWWLAVGAAVWAALYLQVGRWARERYGAATDPRIGMEVRAALARSGVEPPMWATVAWSVLSLALLAASLTARHSNSMRSYLFIAALAHLFGLFRRRGRIESGGQSNADAPSPM